MNNISLNNLVNIFGKEPLVRQVIKDKEVLDVLRDNLEHSKDCLKFCHRDIQWFFEAEIDYWNKKLEVLTAKIKRHQFIINPPMYKNGVEIEDIKAIPIKEVVETYVTKEINPNYYKAPWRNEKTASLCVYPKTNSWYDFGESIGGSNIDFIMKLNDCGVKEAINILKDMLSTIEY